MTKVEQLRDIIKASEHIVFFGGAGVSVASNIPDFRSESGIYKQTHNSPETILSHSFFMKYPKEFYQFYKQNMIYKNALPNDAHKALKKLEDLNKLKAIITQNIDNLHQLAGSTNVIELHGNVYRNHCIDCNQEYSLADILNSEDIPRCKCQGIIKPDVVLYEEALDFDVLENAISYISKSDCLIIAGTSLLVNPAASLVSYFKGKHFVIINKLSTPYDNYAELIINDKVEIVLHESIIDL